MSKKQYKLGLALSGGGMKGVAHCGVLRRLEEMGLCPDVISGVSAGSIVGSLYADGAPIRTILEVFKSGSFVKTVKPNMPTKHGGLSSMKGYCDLLTKTLHAKKFEDLQIPLIINATDLMSGQIKYFTTGSVSDAVCASACVPGVFNPMEIEGRLYVDGGMLCNLPASILRDKCEKVIGVHVNPIMPVERNEVEGLMGIAERVFHLAINGNTNEQKKFCDLVINMSHELSVSMFDNSKAEEVYQMGYKKACEALEGFEI